MIEATKVPEELITRTCEKGLFRLVGPMVEKRILEGIDEIQYLYVAPWTTIKKHGHDNKWEVWVRISRQTAHVCLIGETHELVNNTGEIMILMAIKGHINYSYDDLAGLFSMWGFSVTHGSLVVNE